MSSLKAEHSSTVWKAIGKQKRDNGVKPLTQVILVTPEVFLGLGCDFESDMEIR